MCVYICRYVLNKGTLHYSCHTYRKRAKHDTEVGLKKNVSANTLKLKKKRSTSVDVVTNKYIVIYLQSEAEKKTEKVIWRECKKAASACM